MDDQRLILGALVLQPQPRDRRDQRPSGFNVVGNQTSIHAFE